MVYGLSKSPYETRRHVYTALTRAKKIVIVMGSYKSFLKAILYSKDQVRNTRLKQKMLDQVKSTKYEFESDEDFDDLIEKLEIQELEKYA